MQKDWTSKSSPTNGRLHHEPFTVVFLQWQKNKKIIITALNYMIKPDVTPQLGERRKAHFWAGRTWGGCFPPRWAAKLSEASTKESSALSPPEHILLHIAGCCWILQMFLRSSLESCKVALLVLELRELPSSGLRTRVETDFCRQPCSCKKMLPYHAAKCVCGTVCVCVCVIVIEQQRQRIM